MRVVGLGDGLIRTSRDHLRLGTVEGAGQGGGHIIGQVGGISRVGRLQLGKQISNARSIHAAIIAVKSDRTCL